MKDKCIWCSGLFELEELVKHSPNCEIKLYKFIIGHLSDYQRILEFKGTPTESVEETIKTLRKRI